MAELIRTTLTNLDISSEATVLTYLYTGSQPIEIIARIDLGDNSKPIAGNGIYSGRIYLSNVLVSPDISISVGAGITRTILISRPIALNQNDVITLKVVGLVGDSQVNTVSSLRDVTPVLLSQILGVGDVEVNSDYGGLDNLTYVEGDSTGIDNATIRIYLTSVYDAGNNASNYILAQIKTDINGRWVNSVMLDVGNSYTLIYYKQQAFGPDRKDITT